MKFIKLDINFFKVTLGVIFSLLWARVMYFIWDQPSFIIFTWFYLGIGSIVLKWVLFSITDKVHTSIKLRDTRRELEQSIIRVKETSNNIYNDQTPLVPKDDTDSLAAEEYMLQLNQQVTTLGNTVAKAMESSITGLKNRDIKLTKQVIENDQAIDNNQTSIMNYCMQLIIHGHLKDNELRKIVAVLGIITELERMGDYAKGIANISLMIGTQPLIKPLADIAQMLKLGQEMLRGSMAAFSEWDAEKAKDIFHMDDNIDTLYDRVFRDLVLFMIENPGAITQATRLIWVVHNLERFADRVTNICEHIVFGKTGEKMLMKTPQN